MWYAPLFLSPIVRGFCAKIKAMFTLLQNFSFYCRMVLLNDAGRKEISGRQDGDYNEQKSITDIRVPQNHRYAHRAGRFPTGQGKCQAPAALLQQTRDHCVADGDFPCADAAL